MLHLKPFSLKLLFFAVGILPLLVMAYFSSQDLSEAPITVLFASLFGFTFMVAVMVQNKLRKMGILNLKEVATYVAFSIVAIITFLILRQIF